MLKIDEIVHLINLEIYKGHFDRDFVLYFKNNKKELRKRFKKTDPQRFRNLNKQYKSILKKIRSEK